MFPLPNPPPLPIHNITISSPWALCSFFFFFIFVCDPVYFLVCNLGYFGLDFIELSSVGTVWLYSNFSKYVHILNCASLSDLISPDSFFMLLIFGLFLCLSVCLGPFLASYISHIDSFLILLCSCSVRVSFH